LDLSKGRLDLAVTDLGKTPLKNIAEPVHAYSVVVGKQAQAKPTKKAASGRWRSLLVPLAIAFAALFAIGCGAWYLVGANRTASIASKAPAQAAHLWAERFEEDVADLFKLQDQVVARLANALGNELVKAEAAKGARSTNPDANDLVMRGLALVNETFALQRSKEKINAARALFEQALAIDPNNAAAIAGAAQTYLDEYFFGYGNSETDYDAKILGQADRAIALAPDYDMPYWVKSWYLGLSHRPDEALRAANAGLASNPNQPNRYAARAGAEIALGHFDEAKSDMQQTIRLSPSDPLIRTFQVMLGDIKIGAGRPEAAIVQCRKALDAGDRTCWTYANLAACYGFLGTMDEAKPFVAETLRVNPSFTIKWYREHVPYDLPTRDEGLRKAGFAEE
jgi:tetratricopeptide (TPR) repeat protein